MRRTRAPRRKTNDDTRFHRYSIALAADLSEAPQQQLRRMEDSGLIHPRRTQGNTRRYSDADLDEIASVAELGDACVNAVGIHYILALRAALAALTADNAHLHAENEALRRDGRILPPTATGPVDERAHDRAQQPMDQKQTEA